jgi:hypothetical protein
MQSNQYVYCIQVAHLVLSNVDLVKRNIEKRACRVFLESCLINSTLLNRTPYIKNTYPAIVSPSPLYFLPNPHSLLRARPEILVYLP